MKAIPDIIGGIISAFGKGVSQMVEVGKNLVKGLWEGIQSLASWIWDKGNADLMRWYRFGTDFFVCDCEKLKMYWMYIEFFGKKQAGKDVPPNKSAVPKVSNWASSLWDGICDFFGIHSPSRKMAWIGDMMMEGLAKGIDETAGDAVSAAEDMSANLNDVFNGLSADLSSTMPEDIRVQRNAVGRNGTATGGFVLQLSIDNFNNYSSEDITDLTNEIMATAGAFVQRKGAVFT